MNSDTVMADAGLAEALFRPQGRPGTAGGGIEGYRWLNEAGLGFLQKDYLAPGQSVDGRVRVIGEAAEARTRRKGLAAKFRDYMRKGWYSLATPVWTNFGTDRGLPISCFGTHVGDSMESILRAHAEVGMQTKHGGGTSAYFGALRGRGAPIRGNGESSGSVHFMEFFDTLINLVSQGKTRRGNFAAYQDIGHPDIMEFLSLRSEGHPIQDLSFGVCVPDSFMQAMIDGDAAKREVWARVLARRQDSGFPYILFTDNATRGMPDCYRDRGLRVRQSNLCTEIMLPNDEEESFVCDLSSMNTLHFDEWEGTDAVEVLLCVLDAVMSEFIEKAWKIPYLERAARFAERHRAVGIGWLGWHSHLQSKMIPYESMEAKLLNVRVAREVHQKAYAASARLAAELGEPEMLKGYGRRHSTLLAIAPTKSSAFILGQASENAEPERSNYYVKDLAKVKHTVRNPYLASVLAAHGRDDAPTWAAILKAGGSVQGLDFLSERERAVFKTFAEISPKEVVIQAAGRQKWIDQGQSLNLMIHPSVPVRDVNALLIEGWKLGVKSFYYQLSVNAAQSFSRDILSCASCDG